MEAVSGYSFAPRFLENTYRSPAPLEEGSEEVDADEREVAGRNDGLALLGRRDAHEETDIQHRQAHGNRCPEERLATPERVGCEDQEQTAHDHLDDTVDTSGEETGLGAGETEVLENLGSVCNASVGASSSIKRGGYRTVVTVSVSAIDFSFQSSRGKLTLRLYQSSADRSLDQQR